MIQNEYNKMCLNAVLHGRDAPPPLCLSHLEKCKPLSFMLNNYLTNINEIYKEIHKLAINENNMVEHYIEIIDNYGEKAYNITQNLCKLYDEIDKEFVLSIYDVINIVYGGIKRIIFDILKIQKRDEYMCN